MFFFLCFENIRFFKTENVDFGATDLATPRLKAPSPSAGYAAALAAGSVLAAGCRITISERMWEFYVDQKH